MKLLNEIAQELLEKYNTGDPWELANHLGIIVIQIPFKKIHGMYYSIEGHKFAFVNSNLDFKQRYRTLLHEIAHACLHPEQNYFTLTKRNEVKTYLSLSTRPRYSHKSSLPILTKKIVNPQSKQRYCPPRYSNPKAVTESPQG